MEGMERRMEGMEQRMEGMERRVERMERRMEGMERRFDNLNSTILAIYVVSLLSSKPRFWYTYGVLIILFLSRNQNSIARTQNFMKGYSDQELSALVNTTTGGNIPEFPSTPAILDCMQNATLNPVLAALGLSIDGEVEEKRMSLRIAIGLKN
jgi:hypothetical protein